MVAGTGRSYGRSGRRRGGVRRTKTGSVRRTPPRRPSRSAKLDVRMMLEGLPHRPFDLAECPRVSLRRLTQRFRQGVDHEAVGSLVKGERTRFATSADDTAGRAGKADQMLCVTAAGAGGELGGEAGHERQLGGEGWGSFHTA